MVGASAGAALGLLLSAGTAVAQPCFCTFVEVSQPAHVAVRPEGASAFLTAQRSMSVRSGAVLRVVDPAGASLLCDDGPARKLTPLASHPSFQAVPCRAAAGAQVSILAADGTLQAVDDTLMTAGAAGAITVLSPRRTLVRTRTPRLRWQTLPGVDTYFLTVRGAGLSHRESVSAQSDAPVQEYTYPASAPPLVPGVAYKFLLTGGDHPCDLEGLPDMGFRVMPPEQVQLVEQEEAALRALHLPRATEVLLLARLDARYGLRGDAIALLQAAPDQVEPESLRLLGALARYIGLGDLARGSYLQVLAPSMQSRDTSLGQADAHAALGALLRTSGNPKEAAAHFASAAELYQSLGLKEKATALRARASGETAGP